MLTGHNRHGSHVAGETRSQLLTHLLEYDTEVMDLVSPEKRHTFVTNATVHGDLKPIDAAVPKRDPVDSERLGDYDLICVGLVDAAYLGPMGDARETPTFLIDSGTCL